MNYFELAFLELGFSWTTSKCLPYILAFFLGILIFVFLKRLLKSVNKFLKVTFLVIGLVLPFTLYFAWSPIYEGDFSNKYRIENIEKIQQEREHQTFVFIAIPNCKYCKGALKRIEKMIERQPNLNVEVVVCTRKIETLNWYKKFLSEKIKVTQVKYPNLYRRLAKNRFPSFALVQKESIATWEYDYFGVRAMDFIESVFSKQK